MKRCPNYYRKMVRLEPWYRGQTALRISAVDAIRPLHARLALHSSIRVRLASLLLRRSVWLDLHVRRGGSRVFKTRALVGNKDDLDSRLSMKLVCANNRFGDSSLACWDAC